MTMSHGISHMIANYLTLKKIMTLNFLVRSGGLWLILPLDLKKKNVVQCEKDIKMVFVFLFNSK